MANVVLFRVGDQTYSLPLAQVIEIAPIVRVIPIPGIAPPVSGYIRFRGTPIAVVDLAQRLGLERPPHDSLEHHLLIVNLGERIVALHVDRVLELGQSNAAPIPLEQSASPIAGISPRADGSWLIVDLQGLLNLEQRRSVAEALAALEREGQPAP